MRKISWADRVLLILQRLEGDTQGFYSRREVGLLFEIGRSQASDLMKVAGSETRPGLEARALRVNLLAYVRSRPEAVLAIEEREQKLRNARRSQPGIRLPQWKPSDERVGFEDLTDVSIEPGRLTIQFSDSADLVSKLYQLAKASFNEPDIFQKLCDGPEPQGLVNHGSGQGDSEHEQTL